MVGYALHRLPNSSSIPWHRVVNTKGELSLMRKGRASGFEQRLRLEREGVRVNAAFRVSMTRFGWRPKSDQSRAVSKIKKRSRITQINRARIDAD
jgi:methylated-DNA-protein-cysteine methyltransferase-like protein